MVDLVLICEAASLAAGCAESRDEESGRMRVEGSPGAGVGGDEGMEFRGGVGVGEVSASEGVEGIDGGSGQECAEDVAALFFAQYLCTLGVDC